MTRDSTIEALRRAAQTIESQLTLEARVIGLSPRQLTVILTLTERPGLTAVEIQRATKFDKNTTMVVLRALAADGYITRTQSKQHNIAKINTLTAKGAEAAKRGRVIHRRINARVDALVEANARSAFPELLDFIGSEK
jgi:DNA-binding MarR family transcriptional regulator